MARFCVDCRFFEGKVPVEDSTCGATLDIVTGEQSHPKCIDARQFGAECGRDGLLFKEADGVQEKRIARDRARRLVDDANSASGKRLA